ncbi:hypothetical protein JT305_07750 [Salmonella enterica subsp. enterica serovar Senftenberg]|nr:hypothetical protein [Salmonella enterica subsp. enterica serovar Senftenberg]
MNDCPRRYTQKKAAYRSVSPLHKNRQCKLAGLCFTGRQDEWLSTTLYPKESGLSVSFTSS